MVVDGGGGGGGGACSKVALGTCLAARCSGVELSSALTLGSACTCIHVRTYRSQQQSDIQHTRTYMRMYTITICTYVRT